MLLLKRLVAFVVTNVAVFAGGTAAFAADGPVGQPHPWQIGLQAGVTPVMDDIIWFHNFLVWLIAAITLFVLVLLVLVVVKFNARSNPVPSRTALLNGGSVGRTISGNVAPAVIAIETSSFVADSTRPWPEMK